MVFLEHTQQPFPHANEGRPAMERREIICTICAQGHEVKIKKDPNRPNGEEREKYCKTCGKKTIHKEIVLETFFTD
jgi:ribosomal protein L33